MSELVMNRMAEEEYRKHPGVNKSTLWEIRKSPMHYKYMLEHPGEDTPTLKFGRAVHAAVLQPEEFNAMYVVAPADIDRRTKLGKEAWAAFVEQAGNREILTEEEFDTIKDIQLAVHEQAGWLLEGCETEVPLFWDDPRTGIGCKCRVDAYRVAQDALGDVLQIIDLKTTTDASTKAFERSAVNYGYHVQAAHYINGAIANRLGTCNRVEWYFIAVEKKAPYAVNVLKADTSFLDEGQYRLMGMMDRLDGCLEKNEWPGYGSGEVSVPEWAMKDEEEDE